MTRLAPAVAIAAILAAPAVAQDNSKEFSAGRAEYMASCAAFHGRMPTATASLPRC